MPKLISQVLGGTLMGLALLLGASGAASESVTTRITNNDYDDEHPAISGSNVVWQGYDGSDEEIHLGEGARWIPPDVGPTLSPPALVLLTGFVLGTAAWLIRRQGVTRV